jgi:hypothetical protein
MCTFRVVFNAPHCPDARCGSRLKTPVRVFFARGRHKENPHAGIKLIRCRPSSRIGGSKNGSACHRFNEAEVAPIALKPTLGEPEQKFWQISASEIRNVTLYTWKS